LIINLNLTSTAIALLFLALCVTVSQQVFICTNSRVCVVLSQAAACGEDKRSWHCAGHGVGCEGEKLK
jgi:hypothetical protein